jgi:hypothetical protein
VPAHTGDLDTPPPHRLRQAGRVALQGRHEPGREGDGQGRATGERRGRDEAVVVEQERVRGEGEPDGGEAERGDRGEDDFLARDVELPEHGNDRALPEHVDAGRLQERPDQEDPERRAHGPEEVWPEPRARLQAEPEQRPGQQGEREDAVHEERRSRGGREQGRRGGGRQSH